MSDSKFKCDSCGYVYEPEFGDMISGIPAGTPFEQLPDNWICPLCGVSKDSFTEISE